MTGIAWVFMSVSFVVILGAAGAALKKIVGNQQFIINKINYNNIIIMSYYRFN